MQRLRSTLQHIDGRGYGAYKELRGTYQLRDWTLIIDHVQGDPFAAPSRLRLRLPLEVAGFPATCLTPTARRIALGDFLTRAFHGAIRQHHSRQRGGLDGLRHVKEHRQGHVHRQRTSGEEIGWQER